MIPQFSYRHVSMFAVAFVVVTRYGSSPMFASALNLTLTDCTDIDYIMPSVSITEDVNVFVEATDAFVCETLTTLDIDGPYKVRVILESQNVKVENVRFVISGGVEVSISSLADEDDMGILKIAGGTPQDADGGVFNVESGSSLTFMVPVALEDNYVMAGYSGGAVYAGGQVDFAYEATFLRNKAMGDDDGDIDAGNGGAIAVGPEGAVTLHDFSFFTENVVDSGGQGGAIENLGYLEFGRASYFRFNEAKENGDEVGGLGGALYTGEGSTTYFRRRTIMQNNEASNGGALYNSGSTELASNGFFRGNKALGTDAADGGHIYTAGTLEIQGSVNLSKGSARRDGGAIYVAREGVVTAAGSMFNDNEAGESCDDAAFVADNFAVECQSFLPGP